MHAFHHGCVCFCVALITVSSLPPEKNYPNVAFAQIYVKSLLPCVLKGANDNLKQPKPAGTAAQASESSRLWEGQDLVQSLAPSPGLSPLNLARTLGTYCTISPNAVK